MNIYIEKAPRERELKNDKFFKHQKLKLKCSKFSKDSMRKLTIWTSG